MFTFIFHRRLKWGQIVAWNYVIAGQRYWPLWDIWGYLKWVRGIREYWITGISDILSEAFGDMGYWYPPHTHTHTKQASNLCKLPVNHIVSCVPYLYDINYISNKVIFLNFLKLRRISLSIAELCIAVFGHFDYGFPGEEMIRQLIQKFSVSVYIM